MTAASLARRGEVPSITCLDARPGQMYGSLVTHKGKARKVSWHFDRDGAVRGRGGLCHALL